MAAGNHSLGTIRGTIEIDYDGAGVVRAIRDTDKAKSSSEKLTGASDKVLAAFGKFASGGLKLAGTLNLVTNGAGVVAGALAALGPIAAAGFAAAPGVILAYVSVLTIAKIAVKGVGDAMAAAGEGGKKFDEAMKKLSPEAQRFVKAYQKAIPVLDGVKKAIQDAFFKGTAGQVGGVVKAVASLGGPASAVSGTLGDIASNVAKWATTNKSIAGMKAILAGVNAFLLRIKGSLGPVIESFISVGAQVAKFGDLVGGKLNSVFDKLDSFLMNLDVGAVFAKAAPIVEQLGAFFGDLFGIVSKLFAMFSTDGANAAGLLAELASKLNEFLSSAEGQAAIDALGQALQAISTAGGQIFLALLQALAPAIVALAPGVTTLATQIAGVLVPAINALAPALSSVAGFLSENMSWIGPLAGAVVAAATAYKVYAAAATAVAAIQAVLASRFVVSTAAWVANTAATVASGIAAGVTSTIQGVKLVGSVIASTAAIVAQRIALVAGTAAMLIVKGAVLAWTAVQWLLNAALTANPIGIVVVAIAALVAGIIYAYRNSETFRNIVQAVWKAIKVAIGATVDWIVKYVWPVIQRIIQLQVAYWKFLWNAIKAVWAGIVFAIRTYINIVRTVITTVVNAIRAVWNAWLNGLKIVARTVWSAIVSFIQAQINRVRAIIANIKAVVAVVRNAFSQAKAAVQSQLSAMVSLVRGLPGRVSSALGNIGRLLYNKGQSLVRGFINGIASMIGAVRDKAASVVKAVTDFLPGSPAKTGPLSGQGYVLLRARRFMDDFARGIGDGALKPRAALLGAVNPLARAVVPAISKGGSGGSGVGSYTPAPSAPRHYHLEVDGKTLATIVVDTITGNPILVHKAAQEGIRQDSWAGSGRRLG